MDVEQEKVLNCKSSVALYFEGKKQWNKWASDHKGWKVDFSSHLFDSSDFSGFVFPGDVSFQESEFKSVAIFEGTQFCRSVDFAKAIFRQNVSFSKAQFVEQPLLRKTSFNGYISAERLNLSGFDYFSFEHSVFGNPRNLRFNCSHSHVSDAHDLIGNLEDSNFAFAKIRNFDFSRSQLNRSDLRNAELLEVTFSSSTKLKDSKVEGCIIDRYALECMGDTYGELTIGQRMTMKIRDDVASLRASFSGFWSTLHIGASLIFVFPYLWFIAKHWPEAEFIKDKEFYVPFYKAIGLNIWNGGQNLESGVFNFHWSFIVFILLLMYNIARLTLLAKTKLLELEQNSTGLPAMFSFKTEKRWNCLFLIIKWGIYGNFLLVMINTYYFLLRQISLMSLGAG